MVLSSVSAFDADPLYFWSFSFVLGASISSIRQISIEYYLDCEGSSLGYLFLHLQVSEWHHPCLFRAPHLTKKWPYFIQYLKKIASLVKCGIFFPNLIAHIFRKLPIFEILWKILFENLHIWQIYFMHFCLYDKCVILWENGGTLFWSGFSSYILWKLKLTKHKITWIILIDRRIIGIKIIPVVFNAVTQKSFCFLLIRWWDDCPNYKINLGYNQDCL